MSAWKAFKKQFDIRHFVNYIVLFAVLILFIVLNQMGILKKSDLSTLTRIGFSMILAVSLNLVVGFLGELSLGHAGFMCVGAYTGAFFSNLLTPILGGGLLNLLASFLIGGLFAALFGILIGLPVLRLKGDYLAITTLAFGEIVRNVCKNIPIFGGAKGISTDIFDASSLFVITWIVLICVLILIQNLIRSKHGRAITSIRDNEIASRAMGIHVTFYKLLAFVLAAFFAGIAGVIYAKFMGSVRQENFDYNYSIEILVMVVLGGIGSVNGSMIAAAVITYINILLKNSLDGTLAPLKLIVYALILIGIILFSNSPKFSSLRDKVSPHKWIDKHRKKDSAAVRPDEAKWNRITSKIDMDEVLRVGIKNESAEKTEDSDV